MQPSRRSFMTSMITASCMGAAAVKPSYAQQSSEKIFVLVHGSFLGGWCWREVKDYLQRLGHQVFTPTLTGLGERVHLRSPEINLSTHIQDVIKVIEWEELENVILVGHSYGGTVIHGVCDRLKQKIKHAVFLDSNVPENGETNYPGVTLDIIKSIYGPLQDDYLIPYPKLLDFGIRKTNVSQETYERYKRRLTPQPVNTYLEPLHLNNGGSDGLQRTYIYCLKDKPHPRPAPLEKLLQRVQGDSWHYEELDCGHNAMTLMPNELSNLLIEIQR